MLHGRGIQRRQCSPSQGCLRVPLLQRYRLGLLGENSLALVGVCNDPPGLSGASPGRGNRTVSTVNVLARSVREDDPELMLSGRSAGLRSGSSRSTTPSPASVVSTPFDSPCRAPAPGTWSIGRGAPRFGRGPERIRLFDVSSLWVRGISDGTRETGAVRMTKTRHASGNEGACMREDTSMTRTEFPR